MKKTPPSDYPSFFREIKEMIFQAQLKAMRAVNSELLNLYSDIGKSIVDKQENLGWGKSVVENLSHDLQKEFPGIKGFSIANLWRMRMFYLAYRGNEKLAPLVREIGWSHNIIILEKCQDAIEKEFYIRMTKKYGWTKSILIHQIEGKSYERYLVNQTNFDENLAAKYRCQAKMAVKDSYNFDFLELGNEYDERELELGLLKNIRSFLLEMGGDFSFIGNQYKLELDDKVRRKGENPSIGIIICKTKNRTVVEYALRNTKSPVE
jgi:predicted nuclease of restriction endonuclease-like (RecB) superfamily